ncbi:5'-nucleotidase, lipoprotein e(P4) family [Niveispirillum fermenti]|uniref:5'-nucleotidase, lipoprotein e(P4) family n=1 Tax=Niveispirillum fermenti TaxID=1233113 RepID=UPI003A85EE86
MRSIKALLLAASFLALTGCAVNVGGSARRADVPPPPAAVPAPPAVVPGPADDPRLNATLYMQQAEELRRLSRQAFALATIRLPAALRQPGSAALEQADGGAGKPPAVIFDVDETVLDNSPHQARAILGGVRHFDLGLWDEWLSERAATPMPGAVDFVKELRRNNVRVVYITNRECRPRPASPGQDCPQHADTIANLNAVGLGPVAPEDLMLKGQGGWPSDKAPRRIKVAETHRIIMSLGDQFSDMMSVTRRDDSTARARIAADHEALWDTRWVVIPNPTYGQWLDVLPAPTTDMLRPEIRQP